MSDQASVSSNDTGEVTNTAETIDTTSSPAPASTAREALERAFSSVKDSAGDAASPAKPGAQRDESGRFAAKAPAQPDAAAPAAPTADKPASLATPDAAAAATLVAPTRFAKAAQDAWAQTPDAVRVETERAIHELTQGLDKYKGAAEAFEPLRRFDEMAKSGGTTLPAAVEAYVNMENLLRTNPVEGLREVCKNIGVDPAAMAALLAGKQPDGTAAPAGDNSEVAALKAELAQLKNELGGVGKTLQEQQMERIRSNVDTFAAANPRFDELSDTIAEMLRTGFAKDLPDAYGKAERLHPAAAAPVTAGQTAQAAPATTPATDPAAQTRAKAALTITGSPTAGSNPSTRKPAGSPREALAAAFAQVGGI